AARSLAVTEDSTVTGSPRTNSCAGGPNGGQSCARDSDCPSSTCADNFSGRATVLIPGPFHTFLTVPLNTPQPPAAGDAFGSGVALAGGQAFVGAPGNDAAAENAGAVYVFQGAPTVGVLCNFLRTIY